MNKLLNCLICLLMCAALLAAVYVPAFAQTLTPGEKSEAVSEAKLRLYELKYYATRKAGKTYDDAMREHLMDFQRVNGLPVTGIMDEVTWDILFSDEARSSWRAPLITDATAGLYIQPSLPEDFPDDLVSGLFRAEDQTPYVHADRSAGFWSYISADTHIEIRRMAAPETPLVWFETDIWLTGEQKLRTLMNPKSKKIAARDPRAIAEEYGAVLAFSDDFYGYRRTQRINNAGRQQWEIVGFFDDNIAVGTQVSHYGKVLGGINELNAYGEPLALAIAVGAPMTRKKIHERISNPNISFPNLIAPSFRILDRQTFDIGEGNIIRKIDLTGSMFPDIV